jgi:DNA-binding NtrC family response regulator
MKKILFAWIGQADRRGEKNNDPANTGPIANAVAHRKFDELVLLWNYPNELEEADRYCAWIRERTAAEVKLILAPLSSPTDIREIWPAVVAAVTSAISSTSETVDLTFHLSPGTPSMAVVWIILGKTRFPATLIQSSIEEGVRDAVIPFDISAEILPSLLKSPDEKLKRLSTELPSETSEFGKIFYRSTQMQHVVARAKKAALRSIPVLIEGESGTGKELLARAIKNASPRRDGPFRVVNCGAIPAELVESEIFGHMKGSFTGAIKDHVGYFEAADGGTLFLDEVGELPLAAQVKLLRVLQEGTVTRVGATEAKAVDVRVIAATNRSLISEASKGSFREDLFYRLAVLQLTLPPLRERTGDVGPLIDVLLSQINMELEDDPGFEPKSITPSARSALLAHSWPGNVRELQNTLRRAAVWTEGTTIAESDIREALSPVPRTVQSHPLLPPLGEGFSLEKVLASVEKSYLDEAMKQAGNNKTKAARFLDLGSHQVLTNRLQRHAEQP